MEIIMKNTQNTNKALVDALVFNNRFASKSVNGEQISAEALAEIVAAEAGKAGHIHGEVCKAL